MVVQTRSSFKNDGDDCPFMFETPRPSKIMKSGQSERAIGSAKDIKPCFGAPSIKEPGICTPTISQPGTSTIATSQSNVGTPSTKESGMCTPTISQPGTSTIATSKSNVCTPSTKEPGMCTPTISQPGTSTIATSKSNVGTPSTKEPGMCTLTISQPDTSTIATSQSPATNMPDIATTATGELAEMPNWQFFHHTTHSKLSHLLYNKLLADIYLVIGVDTSRQEIPAHRFVLALNSPIFAAMFNGHSPVGEKLELPDCEPEAFHRVLKYIYTEKVAFESNTVLSTLFIAKKYKIETLEKVCLNFILKDVSSENAFRRLIEAHQIGEASLVDRCLETIDKNPSASFMSEEFINVTLDDLCRVLVRNTLVTPEIVVFRAAKRWAEAQCKRQDLAVTPENQREVLGTALFLIRFPLMTAEEFAHEVAVSDLLTEKQNLQLFKYLNGCPEVTSAPFLWHPRRFERCHTRIYLDTASCFRTRFRDRVIPFELSFFVRADHRVYVDGFAFERSDKPGDSHHIKVSLKNTSGDVLGGCEKTYITPIDKNYLVIKAMLSKPVQIQTNALYRIEGSITLDGTNYNCRELLRHVEGIVPLSEYGDVSFNFVPSRAFEWSDRAIQSHVAQGVVSRIYFHCV